MAAVIGPSLRTFRTLQTFLLSRRLIFHCIQRRSHVWRDVTGWELTTLTAIFCRRKPLFSFVGGGLMVILLGQKQAVRVEAADHLRSESSITPGEAPQRQLPPPPQIHHWGGSHVCKAPQDGWNPRGGGRCLLAHTQIAHKGEIPDHHDGKSFCSINISELILSPRAPPSLTNRAGAAVHTC